MHAIHLAFAQQPAFVPPSPETVKTCAWQVGAELNADIEHVTVAARPERSHVVLFMAHDSAGSAPAVALTAAMVGTLIASRLPALTLLSCAPWPAPPDAH